MKVGIFGSGAWGKALAILALNANHNVILWSYNGIISDIDGFTLPNEIQTTKDMNDLHDCDAWIIVTPAIYFRETLIKSRPFYNKQPVIICTKGMEAVSYKFMSEILKEELKDCTDIGVLSGPQFASEVANGIPTGSTLAGTKKAISFGKQIFSELYLEETSDIIGAEICGVGKNAVALMNGYFSITASGENEKAMLFTRAWNEVVDFGIANGANIKTFMGLCGLGDLFLSATSKTSRNYSAGVALATKDALDGEKTIEGIYAISGLVHRATEIKIKTPMLSYMHSKLDI